MRRILTTAFLIGLAAPAVAGPNDVTLTPGKFTTEGKSATQLITAKNSGGPIFDLVVECGFLKGAELVTTEREASLNVGAGQTVYMKVTANNAPGADRADCRVFAAVADMNALKQDALKHGVDLDKLFAH
jgi:hypothetical protein